MFPDKNIGDALQRVPGITVERSNGEVSSVTIRGTAPEHSQVLLNGQSVASTSWFDLGPATRSFNFEMLSAEQVSGMDVYKSPEAKIQEGAIGGTVILRTRKPLELEPLAAMASVEASYSTIIEETSPGAAGLISWKDDSEKFGVLFAHSFEKINTGFNKIESIGTLGETFPAQMDGDTQTEPATVTPWGYGSLFFTAERERSSSQLTLQYAPTDELRFDLDYFRFELDNPHTNHNFLTVPGRGAGASNVVNANGATINADIAPAYGSIIYNPVVRHAVNVKSDILNLTGVYQGDGFTVTTVVGQSQSDGGTQGGASSWWIPKTDGGYYAGHPDNGNSTDGGFSLDANGPLGINFANIDPTDATQFKLAQEANYETSVQEHKVSNLQSDVNVETEFGIIESIDFGIKYNSSDFERIAFNRNADNTVVGTDGKTDLERLLGDNTLDQFSSEVLTGLHGESARTGTITSYARLDEGKWWDYISSAYQNGDLVEVANLGDTFRIDESFLASYAQANFSTDGVRGNFGLRVVQSEMDSTGYADGQPFKGTQEYTDFLPSANVAFDVADDVIARFAASSVIARPNYSSLKPGLAIFKSVGSAKGGNPNLDPYRANQFDIGLEWYFNEASLASVTLFKKAISGYITTTEATEFVEGCGAEAKDYANCRVEKPRNAGDGAITGIELQYQHDLGNGFGWIANYTYTYTDAEITRADGSKGLLAGVSDNAFNGSVYYEDDLLSGRIAYNYRSDWQSIGVTESVLSEDYQTLDASVTWHVTEQVDVSLEGVNLNNEALSQVDVDTGTWMNSIEYGRRYYLNASFKL